MAHFMVHNLAQVMVQVIGLKSEVRELKQNLSSLTQETNKLITTIQELKNTSDDNSIKTEVYLADSLGKGCCMTFGSGLFFLLLFFAVNQFIPVKIPDNINNYLEAIWERTGFTNTKLQRIEKHLGTDPNHQK